MSAHYLHGFLVDMSYLIPFYDSLSKEIYKISSPRLFSPQYNDMLERYERLQQRLVVTLQWLGAADAAWEGPTLEFLAKACPLRFACM